MIEMSKMTTIAVVMLITDTDWQPKGVFVSQISPHLTSSQLTSFHLIGCEANQFAVAAANQNRATGLIDGGDLSSLRHLRRHRIRRRLLRAPRDLYCALTGRSHGKLSRFTATQFRWNEAVEMRLGEVRRDG